MVVSGCVGGAGEAGEVDEGRASDVVGYAFEGELEGVAEETGLSGLVVGLEWVVDIEIDEMMIEHVGDELGEVSTYVKSPVASLCLLCSSVKKRVRVTMSVLIVCPPAGPIPLD